MQRGLRDKKLSRWVRAQSRLGSFEGTRIPPAFTMLNNALSSSGGVPAFNPLYQIGGRTRFNYR